MNKKVDNEFKSIKDIYVLQCTCTEMKDILKKIENYIIENFTNSSDGEIWHEDMKKIYYIIKRESDLKC